MLPAIVEADMAMAAKVLQLANSAYFGRRSPISNVSEAVAYLGLDALRALVLHAEAVPARFGSIRPIPGFELEALHLHCSRVARLAAAFAADIGVADVAFTAGLLHDVGLLVLAAQDRDGLAALIATGREQRRPLHQVEHEQRRVTPRRGRSPPARAMGAAARGHRGRRGTPRPRMAQVAVRRRRRHLRGQCAGRRGRGRAAARRAARR